MNKRTAAGKELIDKYGPSVLEKTYQKAMGCSEFWGCKANRRLPMVADAAECMYPERFCTDGDVTAMKMILDRWYPVPREISGKDGGPIQVEWVFNFNSKASHEA